MLRYFFLCLILATAALFAATGFRGSKSPKPPIEIFPDMDHQPKYMPQHESGFFADGRAARKPVDGTVPRGYTMAGSYSQNSASNSAVSATHGFSSGLDYYNTGRMGDAYGDGIPLSEISVDVLRRGQQRFDINCAICHGQAGHGDGVVTKYGLVGVANFHQDRLRQMPDGQIFNTITHGKNTMAAYGPNIAVEDRWAIIAYIRALQKSQNATLADVPEAMRATLEAPKK